MSTIDLDRTQHALMVLLPACAASTEGLEDDMTAADDDEGIDVAAMVALSLAKDVALEDYLAAQDKAAAAAAKRPGNKRVSEQWHVRVIRIGRWL